MDIVDWMWEYSSSYMSDSFWHGLALQVFNLFNLIIERLGDDAKPYGPGILQLLPAVWQQAEGQSLLRIQVISQDWVMTSAFPCCHFMRFYPACSVMLLSVAHALCAQQSHSL